VAPDSSFTKRQKRFVMTVIRPAGSTFDKGLSVAEIIWGLYETS
jgi:hypothetical protein